MTLQGALDDLAALLDASAAHDAFKADVLAYAAHRPAERLEARVTAPRVKVLRAVTQLLAMHPALPIERVRVRGLAGCADFRGEITVVAEGAEHTWEFVWDCRWRAREAGYVDAHGFPDQARAAREFTWRCFSVWRARSVP